VASRGRSLSGNTENKGCIISCGLRSPTRPWRFSLMTNHPALRPCVLPYEGETDATIIAFPGLLGGGSERLGRYLRARADDAMGTDVTTAIGEHDIRNCRADLARLHVQRWPVTQAMLPIPGHRPARCVPRAAERTGVPHNAR